MHQYSGVKRKATAPLVPRGAIAHPASDATLAACSASLAHALQELWRARVWGCSLCLAGSDPFTISTMPGPQ